jgi:hypothetical protein
MKTWIKIVFVIGWLFFAAWATYGYYSHDWRGDWIMPMWYKLPLIVSFFGPPLVFFIHALFEIRKIKI